MEGSVPSAVLTVTVFAPHQVSDGPLSRLQSAFADVVNLPFPWLCNAQRRPLPSFNPWKDSFVPVCSAVDRCARHKMKSVSRTVRRLHHDEPRLLEFLDRTPDWSHDQWNKPPGTRDQAHAILFILLPPLFIEKLLFML